MKKLILSWAMLLSLAVSAYGTGMVPQDFYLGGSKEELRVLPNTLRAELFEGESEEVFVEIYSGQAAGITWGLENNNGTVSLFPAGERCMVIANKEGEETIRISVGGDEGAKISVRVNPAPAINPRTFEPPEKKDDREALLAKILRFLICGLVAGGAGLVLFAVISFLRRERK